MLANEQVIDGRCERCGAEVTKRELTQWYFKITDYAQELLDDLDDLAPTWPDRVDQRPAQLDRPVRGRPRRLRGRGPRRRSTVYTTRPDTLFGATFMVVAADAALAGELVTDEQRPAYDAYLEEVRKATDIERLSTDRPEDRRLPGRARDQPGQRRADPGLRRRLRAGRLRHRRDHGRARAGPARLGVRDRPSTCRSSAPSQPPEDWEGEAFTGDGPAINSANDAIALDGMGVAEAKRTIIDWLEAQGRRPAAR